MKLIQKIESVVKRVHWRAYLLLREKREWDIRREKFDSNSKGTFPQC